MAHQNYRAEPTAPVPQLLQAVWSRGKRSVAIRLSGMKALKMSCFVAYGSSMWFAVGFSVTELKCVWGCRYCHQKLNSYQKERQLIKWCAHLEVLVTWFHRNRQHQIQHSISRWFYYLFSSSLAAFQVPVLQMFPSGPSMFTMTGVRSGSHGPMTLSAEALG